MSTSPPEAVDDTVQAVTDLALAVFRVNGALLQWGDALVEPLGLTSARWQMLGAIALAGEPLSAPQVADAMGVTRQGAQKQLNLLLEQGLVQARDNPAHRRSPLYALSARGRQTYARADGLWSAQARRIAAQLPPARARAAVAALNALLRQLTAPPGRPEHRS